jgi:hypothetical protein
MFANGEVDVIKHEDGDLYVNMWQLTGHLEMAAQRMRQEDNDEARLIANTFDIISITLCDLALYELGMDQLDETKNVEDMLTLWKGANP